MRSSRTAAPARPMAGGYASCTLGVPFLLNVGDPFGHVGQHVAQHRERRDIELKLARNDLVERVGIGVVPIEVVRTHGVNSEAGYAFGQQRSDIRATAAGTHLAALDSLEQPANSDP